MREVSKEQFDEVVARYTAEANESGRGEIKKKEYPQIGGDMTLVEYHEPICGVFAFKQGTSYYTNG